MRNHPKMTKRLKRLKQHLFTFITYTILLCECIIIHLSILLLQVNIWINYGLRAIINNAAVNILVYDFQIKYVCQNLRYVYVHLQQLMIVFSNSLICTSIRPVREFQFLHIHAVIKYLSQYFTCNLYCGCVVAFHCGYSHSLMTNANKYFLYGY